MPDRNQKMDNEKDKKCDLNEAGSSVNCNISSSSDMIPTRSDWEFELGKNQEHVNKAGSSTEYNETNSNETFPTNSEGVPGEAQPKTIDYDQILHVTNGLKNMALAHEIVMDKNFKMTKFEPHENSIEGKVKETLHKAFWDVLAARLAEDPPDYSQALILLAEIKSILNELVLPHHKKIHQSINEVLDIDLIEQQAKKGVLNFQHYAHYIIGIMGKVCAPVRDESIQKLLQCTDVIETFKGIMETMQLMKIDLVNFMITTMRSNIMVSSIEYEKAKFAELLKVQPDGLKDTRKWLLSHLDDEKIKRYSSDPNSIKQISNCLLSEAYLDFLEWDFICTAETLMLDYSRLLSLRNQINRLGVIGSIYLVTTSIIGAPLQGVASFKQNIKQHLSVLLESVCSNKDLESAMPNIVLQVKRDVSATLENVGAAPMRKEIESILEGQIMEMANPEHKIRKLVNMRIKQFLQNAIMSQSTAPQLIPSGLSSLEEELADVAAKFLVLVVHNRNVFGEYYHDIVNTAISERHSTNQTVETEK